MKKCIVLILILLFYGAMAYARAIKAKDGSEMVYIPAGEFDMGSPYGEGYDNEHPPHRVYLDGYYMDKYLITVAQYRRFCRLTGKRMPRQPLGWNMPNCPVVLKRWSDAKTYAKYYGLSLPTEAQWEKACKAGKNSTYFFGSDMSQLKDYAWYDEYGGYEPHPVGKKKPNKYGLYDIVGNVWQWCLDLYDDDYYDESPYKNPLGPYEGYGHVIRGYGWYGNVGCKSALRMWYSPGSGFLVGFRCVSNRNPGK